MDASVDKMNFECLFKTNENYQKPLYLKENNKCKYGILSLLINKNEKRDSIKTFDSNIIRVDSFKYESIKKFDEANNSLSEISDFDLEMDEENKSNFNSSEDSDSEEEEIITFKSKKEINHIKKDDNEFEHQIDLEFDEILKELNIKKK
jgi:hypothetical protein